MKIKVKGIAPYPGLRDLLMEIAKQDNSIHIDVEVADLEEALPIVRQAEKEGYDVIVSRGGTASFIRHHATIPVVDISVSGYDILRVLTLIKDSDAKVAIIGFPNVCQGAAAVSSLLNFEIPTYSIDHASDLQKTLQKATRQGAQIILGDVVTVKIAKEMGYHGILITSGEESVRDMFSEVKRVYEIYVKSNQQAKLYEQLLNQQATGILAVTNQLEVQFINLTAQKWLGKTDQLPGEITSLLQTQSNRERTHFVNEPIMGRHYDLQVLPYELKGDTGFLLYMNPADKPGPSPYHVVKMKTRLASFAQIIGSSQEIKKAVKRAKTFAQTDKNVWISGEFGTGKALFAESLHSGSKQNRHAFYSISCYSVPDAHLEEDLFGGQNNPGLLESVSGGTVYLQGIESLSPRLQARLADAIRKGVNARIIASSQIPYGNLAKLAIFHQDLLHQIGECQLKIPPLRERIEDIEEIARVWIADHNSEYGKQIVRIREEVLDELMEYEWPGNIKELKNVVGEMLLLTTGHYVGINEWEEAWKRYEKHKNANLSSSMNGNIDLQGTWEEIEKQILLQVLKEEGMNQSRAAKRLGINRTTLWRKLSDMLQS